MINSHSCLTKFAHCCHHKRIMFQAILTSQERSRTHDVLPSSRLERCALPMRLQPTEHHPYIGHQDKFRSSGMRAWFSVWPRQIETLAFSPFLACLWSYLRDWDLSIYIMSALSLSLSLSLWSKKIMKKISWSANDTEALTCADLALHVLIARCSYQPILM